MTKRSPIRVMIVDDYAVVRSGLKAFLLAFDELRLVGEAASGEEAVHLCSQVRPDVVLMDMVMPGMDGVAATQAIREQYPETQVIALTSFGEQERVQAALKAGALGYLLKNVSAEELLVAIKRAIDGEPSLAPEATRALIQTVTEPQTLGHDITEREREVLALMAEGLSNRAIAQRLVVSQSTVKFHVSSILSKLSVTSRTEAVAFAIQHHLVT